CELELDVGTDDLAERPLQLCRNVEREPRLDEETAQVVIALAGPDVDARRLHRLPELVRAAAGDRRRRAAESAEHVHEAVRRIDDVELAGDPVGVRSSD